MVSTPDLDKNCGEAESPQGRWGGGNNCQKYIDVNVHCGELNHAVITGSTDVSHEKN